MTEFIPHKPLDIAVLFLVFNRLDTTKQVFEAIRLAKPQRLYIAADGARDSREDEAAKVKLVRDYVMNNIDWNCEVKTLFRDENLGCKSAVSGAIDWFFDKEEMGIILEDDCLPSQSFFWFCEELLLKYKDDMRVWHISGDNFQNGIKRGDADYYFSKFNHIWGWATWKNRWKSYDVNLHEYNKFKSNDLIKNIWGDKVKQEYWTGIFNKVSNNKIDTWDYQWTYTCWVNGGLSILPNINLIKNIGFGIDATHTLLNNSELSNLENFDVVFPLEYPSFMMLDIDADDFTEKAIFSGSLSRRIKRKLIYYLPSSVEKIIRNMLDFFRK